MNARLRSFIRASPVVLALIFIGCSTLTLDLNVPGDAGSDAPSTIACASSAACQAPTALCDPTLHICVGCISSDDCAGNTPHCNPTTHQCFSCLVDQDCPAGKACNKAIPRCASKCTNGTDCPNGGCDIAHGYCVSCLFDTDCTDASAPRCLIPQGLCVECLSDTDCRTGHCNNHHCG